MAPHWKCGSGQPVAGSNPALSATLAPGVDGPCRRWRLRSSLTHLGVRSFSCSSPPWPEPSSPGAALGVIAAAGGVGGSAPRSRTLGCARSGARRRLPIGHARAELTMRSQTDPPGSRRVAVSLVGRARRGTSGALYLQSAPAGLNPLPRSPSSNAARRCDVEDRVPRIGEPRTVSGPEGSSTKRSSSGAAARPDPSRPSWWARGRSGRRRVHGTSSPLALDRRTR